MRRSRLLCFTIAWAGWGTSSACESEAENSIGTAEIRPQPRGGGGAGASGTADSGTDAAGESGAAGAADTGAGAAGSAGEVGSGGTAAGAGGGAVEPMRCAERCERDADCRSAVPSQTFHCNRSRARCEGFAAPCLADVECIPGASQWLWSCASDQDCFFFDDDVCVSIAGVGRCARSAPGDAAGGCAFPVPDVLSLPRFAGAGTVRVCADASRKCRDGTCIAPCKSDQQCTPDRNGSRCNLETGFCACSADADCRGPGVSRCNLATGRCHCAKDEDCTNVPNADTCIDGQCGCGSVSSCKAERTFSGTRYVCE